MAVRADPVVVVADDHASFRAELRGDLEAAGFVVCAEAENGAEALVAVRRERPDLCLLDVQMPGGGLEAAAAIARELPDTRIVMLTAMRDDDVALAALRAGAAGYLTKELHGEWLGRALRHILDGERVAPPSLLRRLALEADAGR